MFNASSVEMSMVTGIMQFTVFILTLQVMGDGARASTTPEMFFVEVRQFHPDCYLHFCALAALMTRILFIHVIECISRFGVILSYLSVSN